MCKEGNVTYRFESTYVKDDCSQNCTCINAGGDGIPSPRCDDFKCPNTTMLCEVGSKIQLNPSQMGQSNCFCNKSSCVESKYL